MFFFWGEGRHVRRPTCPNCGRDCRDVAAVCDYSGPMAGGGSDLNALGAKIIIDYVNRTGGVEGYQLEPIYADAQSKPDVAINEAMRLIEQDKVDILLGFFSSAECVPVAA